jgi:Uma2 family endonuclease
MGTETVEEPVTRNAVSSSRNEELFEIVEGQRIGLPPMGILAVWIASQLVEHLNFFGRTQQLGRALCEALFHLPLPKPRDRRPDVAFVCYGRWPKDRAIPRVDNAWDVVPDLAVEVASPTDIAEDLQAKVAEYFCAGVELVWVVYPLQSQIFVYESPTQIRVLTRADELDGGAVVPGFRLLLADLFAEAGDAPS